MQADCGRATCFDGPDERFGRIEEVVMTTSYAGIDPSTKTGWAVAHQDTVNDVGTMLYPVTPGDDRSVAARVLRLTMPTRELIAKLGRPAVVCIEAYSMGSNGANHSLLIEIGYEIRRCLTSMDCNPRVYEVAPTTLKKWATGKGNSDKVAIASSLAKRFGVEFANDNESDAFALAMMAAQIGGECEPSTDFQREAIATVVGGAIKKPPKRRKTQQSKGA